MKLDMSATVKAGLIGAAAGVILALLGRIPLLGCLTCWAGPVLGLVVGVLYVVFSAGSDDVLEGAVGGAISGGISGGVNSLVSGILSLIWGTVSAGSSLIGGEGDVGGAALAAGGTLVGVLVGIIVGLVGGAILGAIGGAVYALIKGQRS